MDWLPTEAACLAFIERLRWPQGFICPACAANESPSRASRHRLMCRRCRHQTSVTAGPFLIRTRTPLRAWLAGAWYVTNQKLGVSALGLQRVLGLGSYQTAWTMLHRFRRAMVRPEREKLNGLVEVDETYHATGYIHRGRSKTQTASELVELSGYPFNIDSISVSATGRQGFRAGSLAAPMVIVEERTIGPAWARTISIRASMP